MKIDKELVEKVARIARLSLSDKEKETFVEDFKEILAAFSKLDEVDTSKISPTLQPIEVPASYLHDVPGKCLSQSEALANTKHKAEGYFKGPSSK